MCGRYSLDKFPESIIDALEVVSTNFEPKEQIYPSNQVDVVFRNGNKNEITSMTWGWKRSFSNKPLINARGKEAWNKKTWAEALRERRCIIPASSFFEWNENQIKGKRDCYRIKPSSDEGFAFAGLFEINTTTGGMGMVILTTSPNHKMSKIHHRMPVILSKDKLMNWFLETERVTIEDLMEPIDNESIILIKM